ncbi:MAG TPA: DUF5939 domain-containing protein, partial [Leptospiraceae bacterium]|nr:DUF5939 domain-containing protein [Leptospiraceae bacterium]
MTLADLLQKFPWPERYRSLGRPLEWFWNFRVAIPRAKLWPLIMDTSRFNRLMELPAMNFEEKDGILYGSSRNAGFHLEWKEIPWSWTSEHTLTNAREYSKGFAHVVRAVYVLEEESAEAVNLTVYFGWIPRNFFGRVLLFFAGSSIKRSYAKALAAIEASVNAPGATNPFVPPAPTLSPSSLARLNEIRTTLRSSGVDEAISARLVDYVQNGDDLDLYRIRVGALARIWNVDRRALLRGCLHATRAGLLTMSYDIICPHCRGVRQEVSTLGDVPERGNCEVCEIDFTNESEGIVEITFHVHPSIRSVPRVFFCSAEPAQKRHIKLQQYLEPGSKLDAELPLATGRYRLRVKGFSKPGLLMVGPDPEGFVEWTAEDREFRAESGQMSRFSIKNPTEKGQTFTLETTEKDPDALLPAALFNLQEFHDLFSAESLAADLQLEIGEQTILFTDMVGSTSFYASSGDSKAFVAVKKHFEEVYREVRDANGAVIKTIGDAVMASFADPVDAMHAAVSLQNKFGPSSPSPIRLRVSIHTGQCIAVNLNSGIDYFGTTVNVAAKIQNVAGAGEIACTAQFLAKPGVRAFLSQRGLSGESMPYRIPGLSDTWSL